MEVSTGIRTFLKRGRELGMGALAVLTTAHCMIWIYGVTWASRLVDVYHLLFMFSACFHPCAIAVEITYLALAMRWRQAGDYQKASRFCAACVVVMACLGIMGLAFIVALSPYRGASDAERFVLCELWAFQTIVAISNAFVVLFFATSDNIMAKIVQEKKNKKDE